MNILSVTDRATLYGNLNAIVKDVIALKELIKENCEMEQVTNKYGYIMNALKQCTQIIDLASSNSQNSKK